MKMCKKFAEIVLKRINEFFLLISVVTFWFLKYIWNHGQRDGRITFIGITLWIHVNTWKADMSEWGQEGMSGRLF